MQNDQLLRVSSFEFETKIPPRSIGIKNLSRPRLQELTKPNRRPDRQNENAVKTKINKKINWTSRVEMAEKVTEREEEMLLMLKIV